MGDEFDLIESSVVEAYDELPKEPRISHIR